MSKNKVSILLILIWGVLFVIALLNQNNLKLLVVCFILTLFLIVCNMLNLYGRDE